MIKAILYDLDGVLVNACEWHYESLNRALKDICGITISREDHEKLYNGLPTKSKLSLMVERGLVNADLVEDIWKAKQLHTEKTIDDLAVIDSDKIEIHKLTRMMGIDSVCVTNSIRKTANLMLKNTGQINFLSSVISNEDVVSPKPNPEGYIKAMRLLNVSPDEVIIVEDSDVGYSAAQAAGGNIIRVKNPDDVTIENICRGIIKYSE